MTLTVAPPTPANADHLRRIVEKQPACLFRVGVDGLILASNDAGLGLLGAQQPAQVLGGLLTTWIMPAHHKAWREFAHAVTAGISQSMECELTDVAGTLRHVDFHGVPLVDHADGIPSLILGARDTTAQRRLEAALHESEVLRENLAAEYRQPMGDTSEIVQALEAKIKETEADRRRLEQALSKLPQLEQLLKQGKTHLQDLRTRLVGATGERDKLAAQLSVREAENERLWAEQVQLQQSLTEQQQRELTELREQLRESAATREEVEARTADHETAKQELIALRASMDELVAERDAASASLRSETEAHARAVEALQTDMQQVTTGRDNLASQLSALEEKHRQSLADHAGLSQLLDNHRQELDDLRGQHEEHVRSAESLRQQLVAEHESERTRADHALRAAATQAKEAEKALADLRLELQSMDGAVRQIEPLAAAGRLALDVIRDLVAIVADIDARAACLVAECPVESSSREQIDQLRADSVRVSSLARQILHASAVGQTEERS